MATIQRSGPSVERLPRWVPQGARRYLAHTEEGLSIRELARDAGCHASTVLRQVQKIETRRDDPLVDEALSQLGQSLARQSDQDQKDRFLMSYDAEISIVQPDSETLRREGKRILMRLSEPGAVMAVAEGMEKAVVVRDMPTGSTRTDITDRGVARALALKEWVACTDPGRISRYRITTAGRAALKMMLAEDENRASGFAEGPVGFDRTGAAPVAAATQDSQIRYTSYETPLAALARRKDKSGQPFVSDDLVRAGERLREDFELSQMARDTGRDWQALVLGRGTGPYTPGSEQGYSPSAARARVSGALRDLGPGLGDVALRCCCFLEGLEQAEKKMGWSARSGKIVLRIALQRLKQYYHRYEGAGGPLIG